MKTKPIRLFRSRRAARPPVDHGQRFQSALQAVEREDRSKEEVLEWMVAEQPCTLCGNSTGSLAIRLTHRVDGSVRMEAMHLCRKCRAAGGVEKLDAILDSEA
jgi:hypothetical protein